MLIASSLSDEVLVDSLRQGNEQAFATIWERYHRMLYALAFKYLKDQDAAQDALQQVFLKLWETRGMLTIRVNLKNYLYTMLKNHVLNEIRNHNCAIEKYYELAQEAEEYEEEIIRKIEDREMKQEIRKAKDRLPFQKRQVCLLKWNEALSNQEIAERMRISVPTVKSHYSEALKLLRKYVRHFVLLLWTYLSL